jgi:hypothetical protein
MTRGEARGAVGRSVVEKIAVLEWEMRWNYYPQIRISGMEKKYAERMSMGPRK